MNAKQRITVLLVLLVSVVIASGWFYFIDAYLVNIDRGWKKEVRINPFYSAEKYLEATGTHVTTIQKLRGLENFDNHSTLLISRASKVVTEKQANELREWLRQGGHLIITAPHDIENDPMLGDLSLEWYWEDEDLEDKDENDEIDQLVNEALKDIDLEANIELDTSQDDGDFVTVTQLKFSGVEETLKAEFDVRDGLTHPYMYDTDVDTQYVPSYWASNDYGAQFVQFNVGEGLLSVVTTHKIWTNHHLDQEDHAYLLSILVGSHRDLIILHNNDMPHLLTLIWRAAPAFCSSLFVILAMWLLLKASRFGPRYEVQQRQRRSLNDHLMSEPQYLWRLQQFEQLSHMLLTDLKTCLVKRGFNLYQMQDDEIYALLEQETGTDVKTVLHELSLGKAIGEQRFVEHVQTLQALRKQL